MEGVGITHFVCVFVGYLVSYDFGSGGLLVQSGIEWNALFLVFADYVNMLG